jgi:hypothetical protein
MPFQSESRNIAMNNEQNDSDRGDARFNERLDEFATDLARLRPRGDRLDREKLVFLAGRASVINETNQTAIVLGIPLRSPAWPAAFAGMTTIAASLAVILFLQSRTSPFGPSVASRPVHNQAAKTPVEPLKNGNVLFTRDAHLPDIESRLVRRELRPTETSPTTTPTIEEQRPILTPTAWDQAINATDLSRPTTDDASGLSRTKGANS